MHDLHSTRSRQLQALVLGFFLCTTGRLHQVCPARRQAVGELEVGLLLIHLTLLIAALSRRRP
jgi:hypothetical protein